ncbi:hypothetical protein R3I94_006191 [Phoxinus phoxinus]
MSDPEPSRIKHEDTEQQIDLVLWASVSHSDHSSHLQ